MRIICMACNLAINFAGIFWSWSASVPFLPIPFWTEFLAHAPVKLNVFRHTGATILTTWGRPPLILVCRLYRTMCGRIWHLQHNSCGSIHRANTPPPLTWHTRLSPHLGENYVDGLQQGILRPSCTRRGLPHQILFGRCFWVILWEPGKPVITDELEVCSWCWSSAPWSPCYDMSFNAIVQYTTMINY